LRREASEYKYGSIDYINNSKQICYGMVSLLALSQTRDYTNGIFCFFTKPVALQSKSKDWIARNQNMFPSGATCLPTHCCFSEIALVLVQSGPHHHLIETCFRRDIADNYPFGVKQRTLKCSNVR